MPAQYNISYLLGGEETETSHLHFLDLSCHLPSHCAFSNSDSHLHTIKVGAGGIGVHHQSMMSPLSSPSRIFSQKTPKGQNCEGPVIFTE